MDYNTSGIMRIIKPSYQILSTPSVESLKIIEEAGRTCYKSEGLITEDSVNRFIEMLIERGHESVLEHSSFTVKFICDRGVSHELVRHRLASFSQESTRYCNYSKDKFDNQLTFIQPCWVSDNDVDLLLKMNEFTYMALDDKATLSWYAAISESSNTYLNLIKQGWKPEEARSVLPNALKTEIVVTANLREWRLIFKQRTSAKAHPQMRELMIPLFTEIRSLVPVILNDIILN